MKNNINYRLIIDNGEKKKDIDGIYSATSLEQQIEAQSKLNQIIEQVTEVTVTLRVRPLEVQPVEDLPTAKFFSEDDYQGPSDTQDEYYLEDEGEELDIEESDEDLDVHEEGETPEPKAGEE